MRFLKNLLWGLVLLPLFAFAQNTKSELMEITEITVKPGQERQFLAGVKLWNECYLKNNGTYHWALWHRVQGQGSVYVLSGILPNWAAMDENDSASQTCRTMAVQLIQPNIESTDYSITQRMSGFSNYVMKESTELIRVIYFKVKNNDDFIDAYSTLQAGLKGTGFEDVIWSRVIDGGPDSPDYFIVLSYDGFSDLNNPDPQFEGGPWKKFEELKGKKAADALRAKARNSIESSWSYLYTLNRNLSN